MPQWLLHGLLHLVTIGRYRRTHSGAQLHPCHAGSDRISMHPQDIRSQGLSLTCPILTSPLLLYLLPTACVTNITLPGRSGVPESSASPPLPVFEGVARFCNIGEVAAISPPFDIDNLCCSESGCGSCDDGSVASKESVATFGVSCKSLVPCGGSFAGVAGSGNASFWLLCSNGVWTCWTGAADPNRSGCSDGDNLQKQVIKFAFESTRICQGDVEDCQYSRYSQSSDWLCVCILVARDLTWALSMVALFGTQAL